MPLLGPVPTSVRYEANLYRASSIRFSRWYPGGPRMNAELSGSARAFIASAIRIFS